MAQKPTFDPRAHVDHMEEVLGLEIRPEWRASVVRYMATTAEAAAMVNDLRLDDDVEIAPTFKA